MQLELGIRGFFACLQVLVILDQWILLNPSVLPFFLSRLGLQQEHEVVIDDARVFYVHVHLI